MKKIVRLTLCIVGILFVEFSSFFSSFGAGGRYITAPIHRAPDIAEHAEPISFEKYAIDYARLKTLENENADLRNSIRFAERTHTQPLVAHRIGTSTDPLRNQIIIDKGTSEGVAVGDPVIVGDGILVGTIVTVEKNHSAVLPLTDPRSKILASIVQEKDELFGIVEGEFNVSLNMTLIPVAAELKNDDLVVSSGRQDHIPAGLVIGTVQEIRKRAEDLFQSAVIRIPQRLNDLAIVSILTTMEK